MATELTDSCPYKGLQPYTAADRDFFFGRERDQEIIVSNLYAVRLTVMYGASGVGKSSVLLAGVVPALTKKPRLAIVAFRHWQSATFLTHLKNEVLAAVRQSTGRAPDVDVNLPFDELIHQCSCILRGPIFFILDQFEEYFLYHPVSQTENTFDEELARAVNRHDINASFVFAMREDGLSKLDRFQGRIPNLLNNLLRLEHLDRQAANAAIRKPLDEYNRRLADGNQSVKIEDELVEKLLNELRAGNVRLEPTGRGQVGNGAVDPHDDTQIETPFLQMVLRRLWEQEEYEHSKTLRLATLTKLGGPENIARTHLDKQLTKFKESQREMASELLRYLVTPAGTKIAQESSALANWASLDEAKVEALLTKLSSPEMRILRTVAAPGQPVRYEIFHDVLARAVLGWRARRTLVREQHHVRRLRAGVALLVLVLAATITTGFVWRNKVEVQQKIEKADNLADSAGVMDEDPELELLLAVEAAKIMFTPKAQAEFVKALSSPLHTALTGHGKPVRSAVFSPNGKFIATAGEDKTVVLWDFESPKTLFDPTTIKHPDSVMSVIFSPDSKLLATACKDGVARIYRVDDRKTDTSSDWQPVAELRSYAKSVRTIAFSPDGNLIATGSDDTAVRIWRQAGERWEMISELKGPSVIRTGGQVCSQAQTEKLPGHTSSVQSVAFSRDGKFLLSASRDQTAKVWKVGTWELLQTLRDENVVRGAVFSPDGQLIVTGNESCQTKFWKRQDDRWGKLEGDKYLPDQTLPLQGGCLRDMKEDTQEGYIDAVNFSPDGKFLVTASRDGTVFIRRSGTWEKVKSLTGHQGEVYFAAYSPDGKFVVSAGNDKRVIVWEPLVARPAENSSLQDLLARAEPRLRRALSCYEVNRFQLCDRSRLPECCR
jgi:WD40 repeat protein